MERIKGDKKLKLWEKIFISISIIAIIVINNIKNKKREKTADSIIDKAKKDAVHIEY